MFFFLSLYNLLKFFCGDLYFHYENPQSTENKKKTTAFANSIDPDEVAHNEPPHLDLHCFPCNLFKFSI